ncbi:MAG: flagellar biosynthesis anti-sigma factor FlgM [Proteobacteria bacterium]|nr:flagellar biosynthesis anti-sigma factor FlgM [Pseudomonadota bacterium]HQR05109.1 flagellar biosynthesis anti-sigma factor FlgM [Rhodocyclaceae bacterium]
MKIDNTLKPLGRLAGGPAVPARTTPQSPAPQGGATTDVQLSSASAQLGNAGGVIDADRVSEIRQAIAEGRFQINPERIADGLLTSVRQLLRNAPQES